MPHKILLLSHKFYPDIGGIETVSEFLAFALYYGGYTVHLVTWSEDAYDKKFPFVVVRKPNLKTLFREHKWADLVFENNPTIRLALPGIIYNRPSIVGLHTWLARTNGKTGWQDKFKYRWLNRTKIIIACSDAIRKRCWPKAVVIGNSYQKDLFRILPKISRTLDFVFLGRLVSDKGANLAIEAFHRLIVEEQKKSKGSIFLSLTVIGDGPERANLEKFVVDRHLEQYIKFTGSLRGEALVQLLNCHKFLVVPSLWEEPFGIVVLEGMACGCVPIVSDGGGLPEAVGEAGLVFSRGNVEGLYSCMDRILNDTGLEKKLREAAVVQLENFQPDRIANTYLAVVEEGLANHQR